MNYLIYSDFKDKVARENSRLKKNAVFILFVFGGGSYILYVANRNTINLFYFISELLCLLTLAYILYNQITPYKYILNKTVVEVNLLEEEMIVKTSYVGASSWFNNPSKELTFNLCKSKIEKPIYPLKQIYDLDKRVFKFEDNGNEAYIITDYFDKELEEKLTEIVNNRYN